MPTSPRRAVLVSTSLAIVAAAAAIATLATPSADAATPLAGEVPWHPGIATNELRGARVVRIPPGVHATDLAALRDDQVLRTTSGRELSVAHWRALQAVVTQARARAAARPPVAVEAAWNAAPHAGGTVTPVDPRERAADLLAGSPTRGIRTSSGRTYSTAQLRAVAPQVEHDWHVDLHAANAGGRPPHVVQVADAKALMALSPRMPDDTVLQGPDGSRATFGQLKAQLKARYGRNGQPLATSTGSQR